MSCKQSGFFHWVGGCGRAHLAALLGPLWLLLQLLLLCGGSTVLSGLLPGRAAAQTVITDLAGRSVRLPAKVERILLGEDRLLAALAIVEQGDPSRRLVGMMGDFERVDPDGYAAWLARFAHLGQVPRLGRGQAGGFSDEAALALRPQVAIFGLGSGHGPSERERETLARLEAAGVVIVFVDFRHEPLLNTPRSMLVLGQVMGNLAAAQAFNRVWQEQLALVQQRLVGAPAGPSVFLESRVGLSADCCESLVGMLGKLVDAAGGQNLAKGLIPGEHGRLNPELLLARQPQVYVGTAVGSLGTQVSAPLRIVLGAGVSEAVARSSLQRSLQRPTLQALNAVRQGRAYALWHHFYNSPFNVVALQVLAKWFYPQRFADVQPRRTLEQLYAQFQPIALQGEYWVSLQP